MSAPRTGPRPLGSYAIIAVVLAVGAGAFAYTAGAFSPNRLTPNRLVDALAPPGGPAPGHRRNHAKGICFTGTFEANGQGAQLSKARLFAQGAYPVIGRLNLATPNPMATDAKERVRGLSLRVATPDGQEWRSAMITAPFFPVGTVPAFYELLQASGSKAPDAMKTFAAAHPEIAAFGAWAGSAPWTPSFAQDRFNSLNSFVLTDASGAEKTVRWSFLPTVPVTSVTPDELGKGGPNVLEDEIAARVNAGPVRWTMTLTVAEPGDPTADPSKAWPEGRRTIEVGTLVAQAVVPEPDGPCRDINYDPTVLPTGMRTSDDPFPAARSSAYAKSFDRRTAEAGAYPKEPAR